MKPRVKICCISSAQEARLAIRYGASAVGLVSQMPSGPGVIPDALIAEITGTVPPGVASFLLTSKQDSRSIIEQQRATRVNTIQLCDRLLDDGYEELKSALPGVSIVQVIHVNGEESVAEAKQVADRVDAILLDSGNQSLPVKELGGTGRTHCWVLSRKIRDTVDVPVFLAGGLHADNVSAAIERVAPFGLDLCSGVRTEGRLDESKLDRFMGAVERGEGLSSCG